MTGDTLNSWDYDLIPLLMTGDICKQRGSGSDAVLLAVLSGYKPFDTETLLIPLFKTSDTFKQLGPGSEHPAINDW